MTLPLRITSSIFLSVLNSRKKSAPESGGIVSSGDCGFATPPRPLGPEYACAEHEAGAHIPIRTCVPAGAKAPADLSNFTSVAVVTGAQGAVCAHVVRLADQLGRALPAPQR